MLYLLLKLLISADEPKFYINNTAAYEILRRRHHETFPPPTAQFHFDEEGRGRCLRWRYGLYFDTR